MSKGLKNSLILLVALIAVYLTVLHFQSKRITSAEELFSEDLSIVHKILIQKGQDAIELVKDNESWSISGSDTLVIRENRISDLIDKVLTLKHETPISNNPDNWSKFSVDDSLGIHLALIDANGGTIEYFVFGRSQSDYTHNYVRIGEKPEVYLTSGNVLHHLNTKPEFWGKAPVKPELPPDTTAAVIDTIISNTAPIPVTK